MGDRYTPEANAAIEQLQAAGFDYAEADMIYHGDMLGPALGARTATLITSLREALKPFAVEADDLRAATSDAQKIKLYATAGQIRRAREALREQS